MTEEGGGIQPRVIQPVPATKPALNSKLIWLGIVQVATSVLSVTSVIPPEVLPPKVAWVLGPSGLLTILLRAITNTGITLN